MLQVLILNLTLTGCATRTKNGELVRHHFGYMQVVTPVQISVDEPIQAEEIKTWGIWVDVDTRHGVKASGSGIGLGYRFDRRETIPESCHVIFRVRDIEQLTMAVHLLETSSYKGEGICAIRDTGM